MKSLSTFHLICFTWIALCSSAFALGDGESKFYDGKDIKVWVAAGVDYRKFDVERINDLIFNHMRISDTATVQLVDPDDPTKTKPELLYFAVDAYAPNFYPRMEEEIPMAHLEFGVNYKQVVMGVRFAGMQTQVSERPNNIPDYIETGSTQGMTQTHSYSNGVESLIVNDAAGFNHEIGESAVLWDAQMHMFNIDLNFGWMLFPEKSPFNIVPSIGLGYSILNVKFPGRYSIYYASTFETVSSMASPVIIEDAHYTSYGKSITPDLEVRLRLFGGLYVAANAGWKVTRIDRVKLEAEAVEQGEEGINQNYQVGYRDGRADSYYGGVRLIYIFQSERERERRAID
jgi:hypothetical protein